MGGTVEVEPEVERWLTRLGDEHFGHAQFYVDLLEREGVALGEPYTRQLRGNSASCGSTPVAIAIGSLTTWLRVGGSSC